MPPYQFLRLSKVPLTHNHTCGCRTCKFNRLKERWKRGDTRLWDGKYIDYPSQEEINAINPPDTSVMIQTQEYISRVQQGACVPCWAPLKPLLSSD